MTHAINRTLATMLAAAGLALAVPAGATITFYEHDRFDGRSVTADTSMATFRREGFNDKASSAVISGPRWERWEVCEGARFTGRCMVLRAGQYASLSAMGMNDRISSARPIDRRTRVDDGRYAPEPVVQRDYRRRPGERLFQADVLEVRAVMGPPNQRCWIERDRGSGRDNSVPAAIAGAVIGGILGHQVGGGTGRDLATIGGVIGGAAVGSRVGRGDSQDVQRCSARGNEPPAFYDVTCRFRGQIHHAQLATAPNETILVNRDGEPRA